MSVKSTFRPKNVSDQHWFWFLLFMGMLTRLPFLKIFDAETTDGILCLTYFSSDMSPYCFLPGYPALLWVGVHLGLPGWLWGRLLSAAASLLFLIPFWKFLRRWVSAEMAGIGCLMALFSPLLWEWSLKVMTDTPFLLFFWWSLERLTGADVEKDDRKWITACLSGILAALIRPEGFLLLPWILLTAYQLSPAKRIQKHLWTLALWAIPLYFMKDRFLTISRAYEEGFGWTEGASHVSFPFFNFIDHFYAYLAQPVYVFTPLVFWFAVLGLAKMVRQHGAEGNALRKIILPVYFLFLLSRLIPTAYQDRHMLPFLPLLLLAAVYHVETFFGSLEGKLRPVSLMFLRNGLLTVCLAWMALFSASVLLSQHDSFGDIKRSSEFLKTLPAEAVIYSDEVPKTQYWSGRKVAPLPYTEKNMAFHPRPGDIVVLHSFYTPRLMFAHQHLVEALHGQVTHEDFSMVVPLLTDVMEDPALQNRTTAAAFRFQPQFFRSRIYDFSKSGLGGKK